MGHLISIIKMSYGNLDAMLTKDNVFYSPAPGALSGGLNRHNWRRDIKLAKEAMQEKVKQDAEKEKKPATTSSTPAPQKPNATASAANAASGSKVKPELISLLKRETAMRIRANTADEIRDMVDLANELGYDIVIEGGIAPRRFIVTKSAIGAEP